MMSTIKIKLQLFSILRDSLPPESNGKSDLEIAEGYDLNFTPEMNVFEEIQLSVSNIYDNGMDGQFPH